jgi:hypothetical protein
MPEIIVKTIAADGSPAAVTLRERVNSADFESSHFASQLVERVGWAVADAHAAEQAHREHRPSGEGIRRAAAKPPTRPEASVRAPVGSA